MTILVSILSSIVAAFLAHYLATTRMKKNDLSQFQLSAYSDFLSAASRLAVARRLGNTSNEVDDLAALNDAKTRIIICGGISTVAELIKFWELGATLEREGELLSFKRLAQHFRTSLGHKKSDLSNMRISDTLFKLEPSDYSFRAKNK